MRAGAVSFLDWLERTPPESFVPVATGAEWTPRRPFVRPIAKGSSWRTAEDAAALLEVSLRRRVDTLAGAESMFKLVGAKQVGAAAIALWRELLAARRSGARFSIWPFEPAESQVVVAEMYPAALFALALGYVPVKSSEAQRRDAVGMLVRDGAVDPSDAGWAVANDDDFDACVSVVALRRLSASDELHASPRRSGGRGRNRGRLMTAHRTDVAERLTTRAHARSEAACVARNPGCAGLY